MKYYSSYLSRIVTFLYYSNFSESDKKLKENEEKRAVAFSFCLFFWSLRLSTSSFFLENRRLSASSLTLLLCFLRLFLLFNLALFFFNFRPPDSIPKQVYENITSKDRKFAPVSYNISPPPFLAPPPPPPPRKTWGFDHEFICLSTFFFHSTQQVKILWVSIGTTDGFFHVNPSTDDVFFKISYRPASGEISSRNNLSIFKKVNLMVFIITLLFVRCFCWTFFVVIWLKATRLKLSRTIRSTWTFRCSQRLTLFRVPTSCENWEVIIIMKCHDFWTLSSR